MIWNLQGTEYQKSIILSALDKTDFPWEWLRLSLEREGKSAISVTWEDLSRYTDSAVEYENTEGIHIIDRLIEGRRQVLGLFYLPPYTKVVLDSGLINDPALSEEVFLAEAAHAVDYHYMVHEGLRDDVWNALHADNQDVSVEPNESGDVDHGHSWFDGAGGYSTWVGETFMEAFIKAFAPRVQTTIGLNHQISVVAVLEIRKALLKEESSPETISVYQGKPKSKVVHDSHKGIEPSSWFNSVESVRSAGLSPCKVCKPYPTMLSS